MSQKQTTIHDRVRMLQHFKQLTTAQLAERIGVQRSAISHVMSGRNKPSLDFIQKLVRAFPEVSLDWLVQGKGDLSQTSDTSVTDTSSTGSDTLVTTRNLPDDDTPVTPSEPKPNRESLTQRRLPDPQAERIQQVHSSTSKSVKQIIVFYTDGTFETFAPSA